LNSVATVATVAAAATGRQEASAAEPSGPPTAVELKNPRLAEDFKSVDGRGIMSHTIHDGEQEGFSVTPIYNSKLIRGIYQRPPTPGGNPTLDALEDKIRELEGAESAVGTTCGMAAISQTILTFLSSGDRLVTHRSNYYHTMTLFEEYLNRWHIEVVFTDFNDPAKVREAIQASKAFTLVWFEPYVNPTTEVLDAPAIIKTAKEAGAGLVVVDNTWLTPYLFQSLRHGADLVVHSATKYLNGHGDAMGGVVAGPKKHVDRIRYTMGVMGGLLRPFDAFLITKGLKTFPTRMERHCASAQKVAEFLESHPAVARCRYAGLKSWRRDRAATYLKGFGAMVGVEWKNWVVHQYFPDKLQMCKPWMSLGDVVTLVMTYDEVPSRGIPKLYTRISIGLEDPDDIIADFNQAIERAG
jgi:methionine-gamma-lyase